jgi:hypothetical protein
VTRDGRLALHFETRFVVGRTTPVTRFIVLLLRNGFPAAEDGR